MDRQESSRRAAQHALLDALRRFCPKPLVELRDGQPALTRPATTTDEPARSAERVARIHEARQRVRALVLPQHVEDVPQVPLDVEAWAETWHLHALSDLAPHLRAYWLRRPAAGERLQFPPRIVPLRREVAIELDPDRDARDAFLARAEALYEEHARRLSLRPHHRRRQLRRHAEWYVRAHVQGWSAERIADDATTADDAPDVSTIRKGIVEFARLLSASGRK